MMITNKFILYKQYIFTDILEKMVIIEIANNLSQKMSFKEQSNLYRKQLNKCQKNLDRNKYIFF